MAKEMSVNGGGGNGNGYVENGAAPTMIPIETEGSPAVSDHSPTILNDGVDGDDERDDEDERENGAEEEEEEEGTEEEPRFKYQRMGGSIQSLLSRGSDAPSCITVAERMIALGTNDGAVHILDYQGNQVCEFFKLLAMGCRSEIFFWPFLRNPWQCTLIGCVFEISAFFWVVLVIILEN